MASAEQQFKSLGSFQPCFFKMAECAGMWGRESSGVEIQQGAPGKSGHQPPQGDVSPPCSSPCSFSRELRRIDMVQLDQCVIYRLIVSPS